MGMSEQTAGDQTAQDWATRGRGPEDAPLEALGAPAGAVYPWVYERCLAFARDGHLAYIGDAQSSMRDVGCDPALLLEDLMAHPACVAFGPVHHFLVGAALLTCLRRAQGPAGVARLKDDLAELEKRAVQVPGAACARWGVCGASASAGMAYAVAAENAPLKVEGWSEDQLMVSDIGRTIALAGAPRCCKRDSRIAVALAAPVIAAAHGVELAVSPVVHPCAAAGANTACMHGACPYFSPTAPVDPAVWRRLATPAVSVAAPATDDADATARVE